MSRSAQLLRLAIALVAGVAVTAALSGSALSTPGRRMAGLFAAVLVLWAGEALPVAVTALLAVVLQPMLGIATVRNAYTTFVSPVFFFVLAMYLLARAIHLSGVDRRFTLWLLSHAGTDPRRVLAALMGGCALFSTVMSDLVVCTVFAAVAGGVLDRAKILPGSSFGRAVMIGIPIASFIGGVATPAGSTVNVLGIQFIEEYGKFRVPFLSWTVIGIPMVLLLLPLAYWAVLRTSPPEISAVGQPGDVAEARAALGPPHRALDREHLDSRTRPFPGRAGGRAGALPPLGRIPFLEGCPGRNRVGLADHDRRGDVARRRISRVGAGQVDGRQRPRRFGTTESRLDHRGGERLHRADPFRDSDRAGHQFSGHNPALYAIPVAFTASCAFLLPIDAVSLVTFSRGYYRMLDMLRPGVIVSIVWVIWMTVLLMLLGPKLGFL
jgi:sodium-dependent dicarboxylate transporter 2/3/5